MTIPTSRKAIIGYVILGVIGLSALGNSSSTPQSLTESQVKGTSDQQTQVENVPTVSTVPVASIAPTPTPTPTTAPILIKASPSPTATPTVYAPPQQTYPSGASAICNDGTYSYSAHRQGTCSHHGGVAQWL